VARERFLQDKCGPRAKKFEHRCSMHTIANTQQWFQRWKYTQRSFALLMHATVISELRYGQGCGAEVKMTQLRSSFFHEHGSGYSSGTLGFHKCGQWRTKRGVGGGRPPGLKNSGQTLFSRQAKVAQKSWKINNISMQWKISGQILFFRASAGFSKFWMIIYIQYSEFRAHSVFQGKQSCSNILNVKIY